MGNYSQWQGLVPALSPGPRPIPHTLADNRRGHAPLSAKKKKANFNPLASHPPPLYKLTKKPYQKWK